MKILGYLPFLCDILLLKKFANKINVLLVLIKVNQSRNVNRQNTDLIDKMQSWVKSKSTKITLSNIVLASEVLAHVSLIDDDDLSWVDLATLLRCLHAHAEAERNIRDWKHDNADIVRCILSNPGEMALQDVVSIEEGLFTVRLDPDLVLAVLREEVEACDVELEGLSLREFAEDGASGQQIIFADVSGHLEYFSTDIINSWPVETEHVITIFTIDKELDIGSHVFGQLLEEGLRFRLC